MAADHRPRWLERHWRPAILAALALLAIAGGWAIRASYHASLEHIHTSQLQACRRGNILRAEVQVNVRVLDALLTEAARARAVQAREATDPEIAASSAATARAYRRLMTLTRAVPQVDCAKVVPRP